MFFCAILILIFVISLGGILFIIIRKFPILANINVSENRPQEKQKEIKQILIKQQIKKDIKTILNYLKKIFVKINIFLNKIFKK